MVDDPMDGLMAVPTECDEIGQLLFEDILVVQMMHLKGLSGSAFSTLVVVTAKDALTYTLPFRGQEITLIFGGKSRGFNFVALKVGDFKSAFSTFPAFFYCPAASDLIRDPGLWWWAWLVLLDPLSALYGTLIKCSGLPRHKKTTPWPRVGFSMISVSAR